MGHINIKLADLIAQKGKSKNSICYHCEVQRTQLNNYCNNKISRVDLALMARICKYLNCDISAILEYVKDEEDLKEEEAQKAAALSNDVTEASAVNSLSTHHTETAQGDQPSA